MSDTDERLAEIKKRVAHWEIGGTITDPVIREVTLLEGDYDWLVMRIRELETRAERDAEIIETMLEIYPDLANAVTLGAALAAREEGE